MRLNVYAFYSGIWCGSVWNFENIGVGFKVGKCTGTEKSCLEMGSYDTP